MLVNLQPVDKPMDLEVRVGSKNRKRVGRVYDKAEVREDVRSSRRTLSALATEGLFSRRGRGVYLLEFHFRSEAEWREFLDRPRVGNVEADSRRLASAFVNPSGRIVATEETTITTFQRAS